MEAKVRMHFKLVFRIPESKGIEYFENNCFTILVLKLRRKYPVEGI